MLLPSKHRHINNIIENLNNIDAERNLGDPKMQYGSELGFYEEIWINS